MTVSLKPIFHCDAKLFALSQWNIGGVGSSGVGHVYFMLFVHHFPRWLPEN